ncbi:SpoIIE family protein phosphatase [Streptomyces smyrnaeus]|uniref:SpoIIE family protein phosphatase n=1 Tax=Streptomyces smyrnaeus TaxID=1387713 RepID=A0ABS3XZJ4_9ACTN|nr:SpoIIE family protein phosphatase [Streptomyces smyrnaeus]
MLPAHEARLQRGDRVLLCTDGVTEGRKPSGERSAVNASATSVCGPSPRTRSRPILAAGPDPLFVSA